MVVRVPIPGDSHDEERVTDKTVRETMMRRFWLATTLVVAALAWSSSAISKVEASKLTVRGGLGKDAVLKVLRAHDAQVHSCVSGWSGEAGYISFDWQVERNGRVATVNETSSTVKAESLASCIKDRIGTWVFPANDIETKISYRFDIGGSGRKAKDARAKEEEKMGPTVHSDGNPAPPAAQAVDGVLDSLGTSSGGGGRGAAGEGGTGSGAGGGHELARPIVGGSSGAADDRPAKGTSASGTVPKSRREVADHLADLDEGGPSDDAPARAIAAPAMKAGRHDDNNQYHRFLKFLGDNEHLAAYKAPIGERLVVKTLDKNERSLHNCKVRISDAKGKTLSTGTTYADGSTHFFPLDIAAKSTQSFVVDATCGDKVRTTEIKRDGERVHEIAFDFARTLPKTIPVDIAVVLDTTGSMQNQIDRLKTTLQAIHLQLTQLGSKPDVRFALVAYRDRGDDYVTRVTPFTSDVKAFQRELNRIEANGGGDTPEDLQEALAKAMGELKWREDGLRIGFVVADAVPHTDYGQEYTYLSAMRESLAKGVKWCTVGAGGLPRQGEVIFRQIAQYTMGEYVFVTQGERGNTDGGVGEASHHVGTNYRVENMDQAMVRIVRRELSHLTDIPRDFDYTIVASGDNKTPRDKVLAPAVKEAVRQLVDYCAIRLDPKRPTAVVPVDTENQADKAVAEYLTEQLILTASREPDFKVLERDLRAIAQEQKLQLSDLFDAENTTPFGKLVGAELLIISRLKVHGDEAELYAKLVRVETGEILSAAKVHFKGGVIAGS